MLEYHKDLALSSSLKGSDNKRSLHFRSLGTRKNVVGLAFDSIEPQADSMPNTIGAPLASLPEPADSSVCLTIHCGHLSRVLGLLPKCSGHHKSLPIGILVPQIS
jgi:hypothetical protein